MGKGDIVCECELIHEDAVAQARAELPPPEKLRALADFFRVLGDGTRMRILAALERRELCVCDLAALLGMTVSAVSHQLRLLREADLVRNRREGKVIYYALSDGHVRGIIDYGMEHINEEK